MKDRLKELLNRMRRKIRPDPNVPVIPPLPPGYPPPVTPNPVVATCGECKMNLHQVMGYVCMNPRCPTGLGGPRMAS